LSIVLWGLCFFLGGPVSFNPPPPPPARTRIHSLYPAAPRALHSLLFLTVPPILPLTPFAQVLEIFKDATTIEVEYDRGAETVEQQSVVRESSITDALGNPAEDESDIRIQLTRDDFATRLGCGIGP
jgi:hypothetical protein